MTRTIPWPRLTIDEAESQGYIQLGRGEIISKTDMAKNPGNNPVYSSSAKGDGIFGSYGKHMFDQELITWSIDGGGIFFYRPKHKFSVTNVCGYASLDTAKYNYRYVAELLVYQRQKLHFDYQFKAHPSVVRDLFWLFDIPLNEQEGIAAVLGSVDATIDATKQVIAQTRQLKRALMQALLTRGLPGQHTQFKPSPLGTIPANWEVVKLGDIADVQTGIAKNNKMNRVSSISVPYLRVANVQDGYLDLSEIKEIEIERGRLDRFSLRKGDVLFNEGGDADKLGRGCVWEAQITPCTHQNHVFAVRCGDRMNPYFLTLQAASPQGKLYFLRSSKQTTNLASINSTQLKAFPVKLPPLPEQEAIVGILNTVDARLAQETETLTRLQTLKTALMQVLLTGEVRVPAALAVSRPAEYGEASPVAIREIVRQG
jgi:restriction endonuclease S subunit